MERIHVEKQQGKDLPQGDKNKKAGGEILQAAQTIYKYYLHLPTFGY